MGGRIKSTLSVGLYILAGLSGKNVGNGNNVQNTEDIEAQNVQNIEEVWNWRGRCNTESALGAEAFACRGVRLAIRSGFPKVEFETDSRKNFDYITKENKDPHWKVKNVIDDIRIGLSGFEAKNFKCTRKVANKAADWVAKQYKEEMCLVDWVDRPPSSLVFILDKNGVPDTLDSLCIILVLFRISLVRFQGQNEFTICRKPVLML
ncbi:hypothetical protein DITRI_Ditri11bG0028900 [Diplodiscus trichospermus]